MNISQSNVYTCMCLIPSFVFLTFLCKEKYIDLSKPSRSRPGKIQGRSEVF